jgi:hypothetical protein
MEGNSSLVEVRIATSGAAQAHSVCSSLDSENLNLAFARLGLPSCLLVQCALIGQPLGTWNEILTPVAIVIAMSVFILLTIFISILCKHENKEVSEIMKATKLLRRRLRIEQRDGYLVGTDWTYPWQNVTNVMHVHKCWVESAAKLSLLREFNPLEFDAFCICLIQPGHPSAGRSIQHILLCEWILETGKWLLQPSIEVDNDTMDPHTAREWTERERFEYLEKLCKCQVCALLRIDNDTYFKKSNRRML